MSQRLSQHKGSFAAGELKPTLHAREDLGFYNNGARRIENLVVLPEGGLTRRPGTRMVLPLRAETQKGLLIPFKFSRTDARVLCVNAQYGRVFVNGGYIDDGGGAPYEFLTPWTEATLPKLRWAESADALFVADGGQPKRVVRNADDDWAYSNYVAVNGPVRPQNVDVDKTIAVSGISGTITLTANFDIFEAGHVGSLWKLEEGDLSVVPYWVAGETVATIGSAEVNYRRYQGNIYKAKPAYGEGGASFDAGATPPTHTFGDFQSAKGKVVWEFVSTTYGFVRIVTVTDAQHATATVVGVEQTSQTKLPDTLALKPTYRWSEAAWSNVRGWPSLVGFVQQRLGWFDGQGQFWFSNTSDFYKFQATSAADGAIFGQMLSMDGSVVQPRWVVASGWALIGAADSEVVLRGPGKFDALSAGNIVAVADKGQGSADQVPPVLDAGVAFIGVSRQRVYYAKLDRLLEAVRVEELSVYANHILKGKAAGLVYQHDPHRLLWGWSQSGELWSFTFRPDQQVIAAHRHPMPGATVESMAAIPSSDGQTEVWMIVRRVINGLARRFVEMLTPFDAAMAEQANASNAWFLDCALEYVGPPTETLTGLEHLAGATVGIFLQGQELPRQIVSAEGAVTIPLLAKATQIRAVVGLPIPFAVETLDMSPSGGGRTTRGAMKRATHGAADFLNSFEADVRIDAGEGPLDAERLFEAGDAPLLGTAMPLFTGRKTFPLEGGHGRTLRLLLEGDHAYPMTLLGLAPELELMEA